MGTHGSDPGPAPLFKQFHLRRFDEIVVFQDAKELKQIGFLVIAVNVHTLDQLA